MDKPADPATPFGEVYQAFLDDLVQYGRKPSTIHRYRYNIERFGSWLVDSGKPATLASLEQTILAPVAIVIRGVRDGDPVLATYGLAAIVGAVGAVYAMRAMDRDAVRSTIRTTLITGTILVGLMVAFRLVSGGFDGNLATAVATAVISVATYVPVVFVMEEVLFRGLLDTYLHGSTPSPDRASAIYGSALWGLWHLPVAFINLGILTIPYLVAVDTALGFFLVTSWRRTGNLAAPGIAHAVTDALRNAVAVL